MKNVGGFLIGAGIALLAGYGIYRATSKGPFKFVEEEDGGNGTGSPPPSGGPKPPSVSGKFVSEALRAMPQASLKGLSVYAAVDNTSVYTTVNTAYTKAAKGQLLGVFGGATPTTSGGYWVNIKTTDPGNPYVKAFAGSLKF